MDILRIVEINKNEDKVEILSERTIKCPNCNKPLLDVLKVSESEVINKYKVHCPSCNDTSFWYKIAGKVYIAPAGHLSIVDIQTVKTSANEFNNEVWVK